MFMNTLANNKTVKLSIFLLWMKHGSHLSHFQTKQLSIDKCRKFYQLQL